MSFNCLFCSSRAVIQEPEPLHMVIKDNSSTSSPHTQYERLSRLPAKDVFNNTMFMGMFKSVCKCLLYILQPNKYT